MLGSRFPAHQKDNKRARCTLKPLVLALYVNIFQDNQHFHLMSFRRAQALMRVSDSLKPLIYTLGR